MDGPQGGVGVGAPVGHPVQHVQHAAGSGGPWARLQRRHRLYGAVLGRLHCLRGSDDRLSVNTLPHETDPAEGNGQRPLRISSALLAKPPTRLMN